MQAGESSGGFSEIACERQGALDGRAAQEEDARSRRGAAQVASKAAANSPAGLKNPSGAHYPDPAARPPQAPDKCQSQLGQAAPGFVQELLRYPVSPSRGFEHAREQCGDFLGREVPQDDLRDIRKPERVANFGRELCFRPATIEGAQASRNRLMPQVVARACVVEKRTPPARAQGACVFIARVGDRARSRDDDDASGVAESGV